MTIKTNPYGDLIASIDRALEYKVSIKVQPMNEEGDITFTAPIDTFVWTPKSVNNPIVYSPAFANLVGEILVRSCNISAFNGAILSEYYIKGCRDYRHTGFGMTVTKKDITFKMHCSFLMRLFNDLLNRSLEEAVKEINVPEEKKLLKDALPSVETRGDGKSFVVQVARHGNLRHTISLVVSTILRHNGIEKDVHVTVNMFSIEVETCDKSNVNYS